MAQNEVFQVLWKINAWKFSDFLHEVTANTVLNLTSKSCFEFFGPKRAKVGPKCAFLNYMKIGSQNVFNFLHKVMLTYNLKIGLNGFFGKILLWSKGAQNRSKMRFFGYYQKSVHKIFLNFCTRLKQHEDLKLKEMIFWWDNSVLKFSGQKDPQWAQSEVFQVLSKVNVWNFSDFRLKL